MPDSTAVTVILIIIGIVLLVLFLIMAQFMSLWVRARVSGASVGMLELWGMRLRKVNPLAITNARIQAMRAGLPITHDRGVTGAVGDA